MKGDPARTLLPSSMMTTSFWAYSWISVSQACGTVGLGWGEWYPCPSPLSPGTPPQGWGKLNFFGHHSSITAEQS